MMERGTSTGVGGWEGGGGAGLGVERVLVGIRSQC